MPIIYIDKPDINRVKGSLLVMPVHSLNETKEEWDTEEYAKYIDSIANKFTKVTVCVHISCIKKGNWINSFKKRGYEIIVGADPFDKYSYFRMVNLFCSYEFVTSNKFGSQIAYASYFGAKASIAGPKPRWSKKDFAGSTLYKNVPELLDIIAKRNDENFLEKTYPFLYVEPFNAKEQYEWAAFQLGLQCKQKPRELRLMFEWTVLKLFFKLIKTYSSVVFRKLTGLFKSLYSGTLSLSERK